MDDPVHGVEFAVILGDITIVRERKRCSVHWNTYGEKACIVGFKESTT